jgi:hypothetical protein
VVNELTGVFRFLAAPNFTWCHVTDLFDVQKRKWYEMA